MKLPSFPTPISMKRGRSMNRRKGSLALSLLLFLTALLTLSLGFLFYQGRSREAVIHYRKGLQSVYGAESGASWALALLSQGGEKSDLSLTLLGRTVTVSFPEEGKIQSMAEDGRKDYRRYVVISYTLEEKEGKGLLKVEDIRSEP